MVVDKGSMTSRERVLAAIEGKPIDRVPVMYWPNPHATVKLMVEYEPAPSALWNFVGGRLWKNFNKRGGMDAKEFWRALPLLYWLYGINTYSLHLGADMAEVTTGTASAVGDKVWLDQGRLRIRDAFGVVRGMGGVYIEMIESPIKTIDDLVNLNLPDYSSPKNFDALRKYRAEHPDACVYSGVFGVQDLPSTNIWNMEKMMMAFIDYPDEVKAFQKRFADHQIDIGVRSARAGADIIFIYDDYGYTNRPLTSMPMWEEFTYPHLKRMIAAFHEEGVKVMLHSCGFQTPFLPYYVEAELDVLQAFQPKAGNDFATAYAEYGDRLTFNTGIDIQVGEMITARELRESILEAYRIGGMNGRHILGMTHMLQYTMPLENMKAIFETVREIQAGRHD